FAVFRRVRGMDQVAANFDAEVAADGSWRRLSWVGGANCRTHRRDHILACDDQHNHWAGNDILNQTLEEGFTFVNRIVTIRQRLIDPHELETGQLQAALLDPG